jgi:WD40-like Beta Propeller Repeat
MHALYDPVGHAVGTPYSRRSERPNMSRRTQLGPQHFRSSAWSVSMVLFVALVLFQAQSIRPASAAVPIGVDMNRIVYVAGLGTLGFVDSDGQDPTTLTLYSISQGTVPDISTPELSPDGTTVLFTYDYDIDQCASGLATVNVNGSDLTEIPAPQGTGCTYDGVWSPNGSKIAFASTGTLGSPTAPGLWVENRDGSDPIRLTTQIADTSPQWSPDGSRIAFTDGSQLYSIPSAGGPITQLTHLDGARVQLPNWSPNGSNIEFETANVTTLATTAMLYNVASSRVTTLFTSAAGINVSSWAPDSNHLLADGSGSSEMISVLSLQGSVTETTGVAGGDPSWIRVQGTPGAGASTVGLTATTPGSGYRMISSDGGILSYGQAPFYGSMGGIHLNKPIISMANTSDGGGYWLVASDGGVFSFGDAQFYGSTGGIKLNQPIVGMAATPEGGGYWLVAADGGVFSFGDAQFYGSPGALKLNKPIVGMVTTPDGRGYWLVASDGGVFSFGDAQFYGSTGALKLNKPIVGMAATPDGHGYWLVASDGGVFTFGDAQFYGSTGGITLNRPIVGVANTPDGGGYWLVASDGGIFTFGDAQFYGSAA